MYLSTNRLYFPNKLCIFFILSKSLLYFYPHHSMRSRIKLAWPSNAHGHLHPHKSIYQIQSLPTQLFYYTPFSTRRNLCFPGTHTVPLVIFYPTIALWIWSPDYPDHYNESKTSVTLPMKVFFPCSVSTRRFFLLVNT